MITDSFSNPSQNDAENDNSFAEDARQITLFVNLDGFEGPIDLLLSLAREQKLDLTRIGILPLAVQYLSYVEQARELNLEVAADYLVMAAWLAYLKSRLLLPDPEPEQNEEIIDMTDVLRYQLVRLEAMQSVSKRLMDLPHLGQDRLVRGEIEAFTASQKTVWVASLYDLLSVYGAIRSQEEGAKLTISATRLYSVQEATNRLKSLIFQSPGWQVIHQFLPSNLRQPLDKRSALASHFVASLELARDGLVNLRQKDQFAPLYIRGTDRDL